MIVIKDIDIEIVDDNKAIYYNLGSTNFLDKVDEITIKSELIKSRVFLTKNERYEIGFSKKVQDVLGIPFEAFDEMQKMITDLTNSNAKLRKKINDSEIKDYEVNDKVVFLPLFKLIICEDNISLIELYREEKRQRRVDEKLRMFDSALRANTILNKGATVELKEGWEILYIYEKGEKNES